MAVFFDVILMYMSILERKPLNPAKSEPAKDAEHFAMQERMMENFGIKVIWFENGKFNEISPIIKRII